MADKVALVEKSMLRTDFPQYKAGDTVKVHVRIKEGEKERIQIFEGTVIGLYNKGASKSFCVRKVSHGVGVERKFLEASPKVAKLEVVQSGKVRRAKLYYIRELEGKAARIERDVETQASAAQKAAAKTAAQKPAAKTK
ncbi:MAG: 50S ribosomal protein L19 [Bdellovibrionales bacterium GWB1_55_8]|nr:MAG: 50S ribosomal protein L19 [Bdellovibrionales bacterium GWB1_55_8]